MEEVESKPEPEPYKQTALIKALYNKDYQKIYHLLKDGYVANNQELLYVLEIDENLSDIIAFQKYENLIESTIKYNKHYKNCIYNRND